MSATIKTNYAKLFFINYPIINSKIKRFYSTSSIKLIYLEQKEYINPNWIIGIKDADGSFNVSVAKSKINWLKCSSKIFNRSRN